MPKQPARRLVPFAAIAACLALTGCGRAPKHHGADLSSDAQTISAVRADLASDGTVPVGAPVRGVIVWKQAMPDRVAVCGQVAPFKDEPGAFVPFVSVMRAGQAHPVDRFVGRTTTDADRVYEALVGYCYDRGGPEPVLRPSAPRIPPVPNAPQVPAAPSSAAPEGLLPPSSPASSPSAGPTDGAPATGDVIMAHDGNLHDTPHGATLRVLPAGTVLHVFGTAPGGWVQVGGGASPEGWMHESMLSR